MVRVTVAVACAGEEGNVRIMKTMRYPGTAKTPQIAKSYAISATPEYPWSLKLCHNALNTSGIAVYCAETTKGIPNGVYVIVNNHK